MQGNTIHLYVQLCKNPAGRQFNDYMFTNVSRLKKYMIVLFCV